MITLRSRTARSRLAHFASLALLTLQTTATIMLSEFVQTNPDGPLARMAIAQTRSTP